MILIKTTVMIFVLLQCLFVNAHAAEVYDPQLLNIIRACVDIGDYDPQTDTQDELMRRFLYTYRNFEILTDVSSYAASPAKLKMCRTDFVKDAMYKAFRIDAPTPSPDMLTTLGYCENNGFYYFTGGYTEYFASEVNEILKIIPLNDNTLYVIFSNYYREGDKPPELLYGSMRVGTDKDGYYVISIDTDDDFTSLNSLIYPEEKQTYSSKLSAVLPIIVTIITFLSAALAFYVFFLRI